MQQKQIIDGASRALGIVSSIREQKYLEAVRIGVDFVEKVGSGNYYPWNVFNKDNGWAPLVDTCERNIFYLFDDVLAKYPMKSLKFYYNTMVYELPNNIQIVEYKNGYWDSAPRVVLYNENEYSKQEVLDVLTKDLLALLNSSCIQLFREDKIKLIPIELEEYPSKIADDLYNYVVKSIDNNLPRSIMLCGEPGAGKSCIASSLLKKLNLRTLILKNIDIIGCETVLLASKLLNIEAILIDDFDHSNMSDKSNILNFLERMRRQVKIVVATVNSTKKFHKALIRPGRFDKLIIANRLDEKVVKDLLGKDLIEYYNRVCEWPIAYVNEFVLSSKLEGKDKDIANSIIEDLQKRIVADTLDLETAIKDIDTKDTAKTA